MFVEKDGFVKNVKLIVEIAVAFEKGKAKGHYLRKGNDMLRWHFCRNDKRLGFGDGRQIKTGRTLKVNPPIKLCEKGLHASKQIIDALSYSQGEVLCKVKLGGQIILDTDKAVATERTVLAMRNAEKILHEFGCLCAERALKKAKVKDKRCWNAIEVKRKWLKGKATDKELAAAWAAAWAAAGAAAWVAARNAEKQWQNRILCRMANKLFEVKE